MKAILMIAIVTSMVSASDTLKVDAKKVGEVTGKVVVATSKALFEFGSGFVTTVAPALPKIKAPVTTSNK
jgi:hypothetical protein